METYHDQLSAMAFIVSVEQKELRQEAEGFVMYASEALAEEFGQRGRHVEDFYDIASDLGPSGPYPAFMTWEGSVRFTEDDYFTAGNWRRSTGAEIIAASHGRNPFATAKSVPV